MDTYFDRTYLENLIGPAIVSSSLLYGGHTSATTGSVMAQFISSSCAYVNQFYSVAGYGIPIHDPIPNYVADLAAYKCAEMLYTKTNRPVPPTIIYQIQTNTQLLSALVEGKLKPGALDADLMGSVQGGHAFSDSSSGSPQQPLVSLPNLKGTFF